MPTEIARRKQVLFVDDDPAFLNTLRQLFSEMSRGSWEIFTAESHAQALELFRRQRVDVAVLDIGMPVMDGLQFLRLLGRTHPGQQVVMLTGQATEELRKTCLDNGAVLFLEKPVRPDGFAAVFAALDAIAESQPQAGFRGMMRRVGLQEVLQMECLGRKSSVLEIFTGKVRGRIYIHDGSIVHAESGALQGEVALYGLLALRGGDFNFLAFSEPPRRTIQGHWESLLMEAARLSDESAAQSPESPPELPHAAEILPEPLTVAPLPDPAPAPPFPDPFSTNSLPEVPAAPLPKPPTPTQLPGPPAASPSLARPAPLPAFPRLAPPPPPQPARDLAPLAAGGSVVIRETILCTGSGEVLFEWESPSLHKRLHMMSDVEQQAAELSNMVPVGRFDRLEIHSRDSRIVCQIQPHMRLFVRSAIALGGQP